MPDEDRIARVARALCVADGVDPEERIYVGGSSPYEEATDCFPQVLAPA